MTDNPRQELEREAREAAVAFWNAQPVHPRFSGDDFIHGYIAAATAREKEIEELRSKLAAVPVEELKAFCEWELGF